MATRRARDPKLRASPPVLAGTPRRVRGHLEIENRGDQDVLLTSVEVAGGPVETARPGAAGVVPVMRALPAGRSTRVPVRLRLDPFTPPGRHEVELSAGGARTTAVVEVAENPRARISPPSLAVRGSPGATLIQPIVVSNLGNVEIPLDRLGAVTIEDRGGVCRSLEGALRKEGEKGYQAVLDEAVREIARTRVGQMRVRAGDGTAVQPGETRAVDLELRLPADLSAGRTYVGLVRLVGASLLVEVTAVGASAGDADEPEAPARPRRARRAAQEGRSS